MNNTVILKKYQILISLIVGFVLLSTHYGIRSEEITVKEMTMLTQNSAPQDMIDKNKISWLPDNNKVGAILANAVEAQVIPMEENLQENEVMDAHHHGFAYVALPLQQVKEGVKATSITCSEGLELVLKQSNGQPACIKPSSVAKLIERGWAIHVLPDYVKNENNNSVAFSVGNYTVETETVNYFQNSQGYLAKPSMNGKFPAVVIIHEIWGLNDNIKEMAEKLASHGYVVLAVDLYDGKVASTIDEARSLRGSFVQQQWTDNMNSAVRYLEERFSVDSIGSIGWCFGGGQSLTLALNNPDMDATVIYYGQLVTDPSSLSKISWPVLGIFAGEDTGIPPETVKKFESTLNDLGIENEIIIYPGVNHAFANPSGDRYAPNEAKDAWQKTLDFLDSNLK